jgi:hypothetical protein|eukprot:SAG25_NODE_241_length_11184_cov_4.090934_10_plen_166_part_00
MDAFEKAVALLGDQYGYSDADGYACYTQRGNVPVATGLKIRTEFQDQVEALSGEFEDEMLDLYSKLDHGYVPTIRGVTTLHITHRDDACMWWCCAAAPSARNSASSARKVRARVYCYHPVGLSARSHPRACCAGGAVGCRVRTMHAVCKVGDPQLDTAPFTAHSY